MVGEERHDRRDARAASARARTRASRAPRRSPSQKRRRERRMYQFERSSTYASYARDHVDRHERARSAASASRTNACVRSTSQRSSGFRSPVGSSSGHDGRNAVDVRVRDEERDRVPERQQLALDLLRRPEAEEQVAVGRLRAVLPAHHVGAHARERVLGRDHVPPRAVHLAARSRRASSRSRAPAGTARGR